MAYNPYLTPVQPKGFSTTPSNLGTAPEIASVDMPGLPQGGVGQPLLGQAGNILAGGASIYADWQNTAQVADDVLEPFQQETQTAFNTDAYGRPIYSLGDEYARIRDLDWKEATADVGKGLGFRTGVQGAKMGASVGSVFSPIGSGIGAVVGFGVGTIAGALRRRRLQRDASTKARQLQQTKRREIHAAQSRYNRQLTGWDAQMDAKEAYNAQLKEARRRAIS